MRENLWLEFEELLDRADSLCDQGRHDEALTFYELAEGLTRGLLDDLQTLSDEERYLFASLYNNWGAALTALEPPAYGRAVKRYRRALQIKPDFHHALANLGMALVNQPRPDFETAVRLYRHALKLDPEFHPALYNWGLTLMDHRRSEVDHLAVIDKFERVLELEPDDAGALYQLACCYSHLGNRFIALDYLADAIDLDELYAEDARFDAAFDWMRTDKNFRRLLSRRQN